MPNAVDIHNHREYASESRRLIGAHGFAPRPGRTSQLKYLSIVSIVATALTLSTGSLAAVHGEDHAPLNTGDLELQQIVIDANKADVSRYPYGEIECEISTRHTDGPLFIETAIVHAWWSKNKSRSLIKLHTKSDKELVKSNYQLPDLVEMDLSYEQIINDSIILFINDVAKKAVFELRGARGLPPNALVTPDQWWFGKRGGQGRYWYEILAPSPTMPSKKIESFHTRRLDNGRLEIVRLSTDGKLRAIISTESWKVIECEYADLPGHPSNQHLLYNYQWDGAGKILNEFRFTSRERDRPSQLIVYKVNRVDLSKEPSPEMFSTSESRVKDGYLIENGITKRIYFKGGQPRKEDRTEKLERLAKRVRESGFLARKR